MFLKIPNSAQESEQLQQSQFAQIFLEKVKNKETGFCKSFVQISSLAPPDRGIKRLVSVNICAVKGNSAGIFDRKMSPWIFVRKEG